MSKVNEHSALVLGLLVILVSSMAPRSANSQTAPGFNRNRADTPGEGGDRPEREQYDNRAFPEGDIAPAQQEASYKAYLSLSHQSGSMQSAWEGIGPTAPFVPGVLTFSGRSTYTSGRVTSLALSPKCHVGDCQIFVGAAGGGVWTANDVLASHLNWHPTSNGIPSNAIGSIIFDPTDPTGKTLYVGTGEQNGSGDSEAGVGLYKSTNLGKSWSLVPGSLAVANGRSIAQVAVDPVDPNHIFIGTAVARHGSSSSNGGRVTPPGVAQVGLYESTDDGATFSLAFSRPSDVVNPTTATGLDYYRGGVTNVVFDRTGLSGSDASRVYLSIFDYGIYRSDGAGHYEQIFASAGGGTAPNTLFSRTEFALAPKSGALRIYAGDAGSDAADFYRVDNALVPAANLTDGTTNPGWIKLSNSTPGTPGFASYDFCSAQCTYDMVVASPPGQPDTVWIGGAMQYGELIKASNGRAVQRSTDAGVNFADMTNDTQSPPLGMHPDQHAIVFVPGNPSMAIIGSDGGVVRTSGDFADASSSCDNRSLVEPQLSQCRQWLSAVPAHIFSLNKGLATLQYQSVSLNPKDPLEDIMGGTQDNGTWASKRPEQGGQIGEGEGWFETIYGDGGQSGVDVANPNIRFHTFYDASPEVNFNGTAPLEWDVIYDPLFLTEPQSFYIPMIADPKVSGTLYAGLAHVWRTNDDGGPRAYLDKHCNEFFGDFAAPCGDWEPLGGPVGSGTPGDLVAGPSSDKGTGWVAAVVRAPNDTGTLWAGTRRGRVWMSKNADAAPGRVTYLRVDTPSQPRRFVSGIAVDPVISNHAWISFSGYDVYTPTTPGHVFEVTVHDDGSIVWKDLSYNLGDQPITGIARDDVTGDLYAATDFGVDLLPTGSTTWVLAGVNLPPVAVYGLTIDAGARVLYAATHGRSAWKLNLSR
jgi:hypothetical protein